MVSPPLCSLSNSFLENSLVNDVSTKGAKHLPGLPLCSVERLKDLGVVSLYKVVLNPMSNSSDDRKEKMANSEVPAS